MIFIGEISKGHNSVKNVGGVTILCLCTLSDFGLYLFKVSGKYSRHIKVIEQTRFS